MKVTSMNNMRIQENIGEKLRNISKLKLTHGIKVKQQTSFFDILNESENMHNEKDGSH